MGVHGEVCNHFLVARRLKDPLSPTLDSSESRKIELHDLREFISLGALYDIIKHQDRAMIAGLEDQHILILGFFVMEDLVHFESHGLPRPHVRDFAEPAICGRKESVVSHAQYIV